MKKGIVLEQDDEFITLLTPDGEFIQVKKEGEYEIGEEIEARAVQKPNVRRRSLRYITSFVAAVVLLIATLLHFPSNEVYAYMSIDINPSIEIGVNEQLKVIKLKAYNEEGKKIVSQLLHWKNKEFIDIAKEIIELSMKKGYLQKGGQVLITTVERKHRAASSRELSTELTKIQHSYQRKNIVVKTEESTMEVRNEAVKKGMTTGKLLQIEQKAKSVSPKSINMRKQERLPKQDDKRQINSHFRKEKNEKTHNNNNINEKNEQQITNHLLQKHDEQMEKGNNENEKKELQKIYHPSVEKDERQRNKSTDHILSENGEKQKHRPPDYDLKHHQNKQDKHRGKQNYNNGNFEKPPKTKGNQHEKRNGKSAIFISRVHLLGFANDIIPFFEK